MGEICGGAAGGPSCGLEGDDEVGVGVGVGVLMRLPMSVIEIHSSQALP